ncbi:hypothetical protein [Flavobacterium sp.]|uniref:hypothetical protein n=1 Tax=Flavobacterium sp. TaxID=239 RepID=UPI002625BB28|nr:hypothetical protein [Flavobacterium sp.]
MTRRDVLIKVLEAGFEKVDIDVFLKATAKPSIKKGKVDPAVVVSVDHVRRGETGNTQSSMEGQLVVNTEQPGTRETRGYGDLINSWTEQLTP